jgi:hypothetical protein
MGTGCAPSPETEPPSCVQRGILPQDDGGYPGHRWRVDHWKQRNSSKTLLQHPQPETKFLQVRPGAQLDTLLDHVPCFDMQRSKQPVDQPTLAPRASWCHMEASANDGFHGLPCRRLGLQHRINAQLVPHALFRRDRQSQAPLTRHGQVIQKADIL